MHAVHRVIEVARDRNESIPGATIVLKEAYMSENKGYAHPEALVDAEWVQAHLHDPAVRLIEVDVDTKAYEQGHIPGAVGLNWQKELQDQLVRAPVSKEQLEELPSNAGVSSDTTIVVYGDNNNW